LQLITLTTPLLYARATAQDFTSEYCALQVMCLVFDELQADFRVLDGILNSKT